jgi:hypothetical protein
LGEIKGFACRHARGNIEQNHLAHSFQKRKMRPCTTNMTCP